MLIIMLVRLFNPYIKNVSQRHNLIYNSHIRIYDLCVVLLFYPLFYFLSWFVIASVK